MRNIALLAILFSVSACASKSQNIAASYVSPLQYQEYSCSQISQELARVSRRANQVYGQQDATASNDAVAMGVGLVLFWPALFFIDSDDQKEQVARLKGEIDAIEQVAVQKNCRAALGEIDSMKAAKPDSIQETTKKNYN